HRDIDAELGKFPIGVFYRSDDAVDLRMPGIRDDQQTFRYCHGSGRLSPGLVVDIRQTLQHVQNYPLAPHLHGVGTTLCRIAKMIPAPALFCGASMMEILQSEDGITGRNGLWEVCHTTRQTQWM